MFRRGAVFLSSRGVAASLVVATACLSGVASAQIVEQMTDVRTSLPHPGVLDDAGTWVYAISSGDPLGSNPEHRFQIFRWDAVTGAVTQLTFLEDGVETPFWRVGQSVSDDGQKLAFRSRSNPTGGNPEGAAELFVMNVDGTGIQQLTDEPADCERFYQTRYFRFQLAGNGTRVVFDSPCDYAGTNPDGIQQIWVVDADGTNLRQLTQATLYGALWPTISDDGQRVAFEGLEGLLGPIIGSSEVFGASYDGTNLRQLTDIGEGRFPQISGDGSMIAFETRAALPPGEPRDRGTTIAVVDWDATDVHRVASAMETESWPGRTDFADITDDGQWVFYTAWGLGTGPGGSRARFSIRKTHSDITPDETELTAPLFECRWSQVSGSGNRITFLCAGSEPYGGSNPDLGFEIYAATGAGTGHLQLSTGVYGHISSADLTPDGTLVVFASNALPLGEPPGTKAQIYRMAPDGTGLTRLTNLDGACREPAVSDDGTTVVFASDADPFGTNPDGLFVIFAIQSDGTGLRQLMPSPGTCCLDTGSPDIAGDGSVVVFQSQADLTGGKPGSEYGIYKVSPDGTGLTLLDAIGETPRLDASGTWLTYERDYRVYRIRTDGTGQEQLAATAGNAFPDISADGNRIVYLDFDQVWLYDALTPGTSPLADCYVGCDVPPAISADGTRVVYWSSDQGSDQRGQGSPRRVEIDSGLDRRIGAAMCDKPDFQRTIATDAGGRQVVFVGDSCTPDRNPDANRELFRIDPDTPARIRVGAGPVPTLIAWDYESGPATYDVIRGDLAALTVSAGTVDLGTALCIENDSTDADTRHYEDASIPASGQAWFYLHRGAPDAAGGPGSYGQGSGGEERVPAAGGCVD